MDIMEEFSATFVTLNELWEEIGFEPNECESSSADMVLEMKRVLSNKISTTQEIKSGLNSQIRLANARYLSVSSFGARVAHDLISLATVSA